MTPACQRLKRAIQTPKTVGFVGYCVPKCGELGLRGIVLAGMTKISIVRDGYTIILTSSVVENYGGFIKGVKSVNVKTKFLHGISA